MLIRKVSFIHFLTIIRFRMRKHALQGDTQSTDTLGTITYSHSLRHMQNLALHQRACGDR